MTYKEARAYLKELSKYGSIPGLDTMRSLMSELRDPQDGLRYIHIAGTNGKGSICAYASSILAQAGLKTGSYTSPAVTSYPERFKIDGESISEEDFVSLIGEIKDAAERMQAKGQRPPTVFEAETAAAFLYFKRERCDIVVLEAGLGGSLDATNIVKNTLAAVFASISRDHMEALGETVEEIAENKAGIIKPGCIAVTGRQESPAMEAVTKKAAEYGCRVCEACAADAVIQKEGVKGTTFSYKEWENIHIRLAGKYQVQNAVTVLALVSALRGRGLKISDGAVREGFSEAVLAGRFTCINERPLFIVDGAHNEGAAIKLRQSVEAYFTGRRFIYIMGVFKDKEYGRIAEIMAPLADRIFTVDLPDAKRTLAAGALKAALKPYCGDVRAVGDICEAADMALNCAEEDDVILAFGSLSYLGQLTEYVKNKRKEI